MASVLMVLTLVSPLTFESAVSFVCMQLPRPSPSPGSASGKSCIVAPLLANSEHSLNGLISGGRDRRDGKQAASRRRSGARPAHLVCVVAVSPVV
eukprot:scaffold43155_cov45-Phaeocystis_antarctica.AAC.1